MSEPEMKEQVNTNQCDYAASDPSSVWKSPEHEPFLSCLFEIDVPVLSYLLEVHLGVDIMLDLSFYLRIRKLQRIFASSRILFCFVRNLGSFLNP
jgi:hypothetical protein